MRCQRCGKETGSDWKKLCLECWKEEHTGEDNRIGRWKKNAQQKLSVEDKEGEEE